MATHGNTGSGGSDQNMETRIRAFEFTPANGEILTSVTARLLESEEANDHTLKAVLFVASTGAFVAESSTRQDIQLTPYAAYEFTFSSPPTLSNIAYRVGLYCNGADGQVNIECDNTTGTMYSQSGLTFPTVPDPASFSSFTGTLRMFATTTDPGGGSTTVSPAQAALTLSGRAATVNSFSAVAIREVLINEAGSPIANRTGISLHVWYSARPDGTPDLSLSALTTDADGTASWSLPTGGLVFNQTIFYVATDGGDSLSEYTCASMIPTYT